jgi:hypothetical protein
MERTTISSIIRRVRAVLVLVAAVLVASCGYDAPDPVTGPTILPTPATITLQVLQSDAETVIRADVRAIDRQPVPAVVVRFSSSIGAISPAESRADIAGVAYARWSGLGEAIITATAGTASASTTVSRALKPLEVFLSVTPLVRYAPGTFTATASGLIEPVRYAWTFGDGATAVTSTNSTTHTYQNDDATQAGVTVTDGAGRIGTATTRLVIAQPPK